MLLWRGLWVLPISLFANPNCTECRQQILRHLASYLAITLLKLKVWKIKKNKVSAKNCKFSKALQNLAPVPPSCWLMNCQHTKKIKLLQFFQPYPQINEPSGLCVFSLQRLFTAGVMYPKWMRQISRAQKALYQKIKLWVSNLVIFKQTFVKCSELSQKFCLSFWQILSENYLILSRGMHWESEKILTSKVFFACHFTSKVKIIIAIFSIDV